MLDIFSQIIDVVLDRDDPRCLSEDHLRSVRVLELRLDRIEQRPSEVSEQDVDVASESELARSAQLAELYRLTVSIYLQRLGKGVSRTSPVLSRLVDTAFRMLESISVCERPLLLFIIALEARTDEERLIILRVLARSLEARPLGNLPLTERLIHAAWVQQDLHEEADVNQLKVYNAVVSGNRVPPSFT